MVICGLRGCNRNFDLAEVKITDALTRAEQINGQLIWTLLDLGQELSLFLVLGVICQDFVLNLI